MSTWHEKSLGDGMQAYEPSMEITSAFVPAFLAAGGPLDFAVFSRYDLRRNVVTVYFSPRAERLAGALGATPCEKPLRGDRLSLLVGDVRAWDILFPSPERTE